MLLVQPPHRSEEGALVYPARRNVEREFSPSTLDPAPVDGHDRVIVLRQTPAATPVKVTDMDFGASGSNASLT